MKYRVKCASAFRRFVAGQNTDQLHATVKIFKKYPFLPFPPSFSLLTTHFSPCTRTGRATEAVKGQMAVRWEQITYSKCRGVFFWQQAVLNF
jgi:hypothetical protein